MHVFTEKREKQIRKRKDGIRGTGVDGRWKRGVPQRTERRRDWVKPEKTVGE